MLIGIDGNEANIKDRVGVNVWAYELLQALKAEIEKKDKDNMVIYLAKEPRSDLPPESKFWKYRVIGPGKFWTRWRLPLDLYLHKPRPDVLLSLSHYTPLFAPMPRIVSIMDLSYLKFPEAFTPTVLWQLKNWTEESIKKSKHVITISNFNKKEIIKYYGCTKEKVTVVYPAAGIKLMHFLKLTDGEKRLKMQKTKAKFNLKHKYLLFVGTNQKKKNLKRLFEAFELIRKDYPETELVIAGKVWKQFSGDGEPETGSGPVKRLGYVDEDDLPALYAGAECFVLPSLYEGFGIPALEAMMIGTPVAVSDLTSFPEIVSDSGVLFDPYDINDMAEKICRLLGMDGAERQQLIEKGMIRARQFDWSESAQKVLDILKNER